MVLVSACGSDSSHAPSSTHSNEQEVGDAIKACSVSRADIFLTTKLGHADKVPELLRESVGKLGGGDDGAYVDLFLIHSPSAGPEKRPLQWKELERLVDEGKAKSIGVSN